MAPAVLEVRRCLLIFEKPPDEEEREERKDREIARHRDQVLTFLQERGIEARAMTVRLGNREDELLQIETAVREFAAGVPAERLAFDLTPGYKSLSLELEDRAPPGSWLLYCRHQQLGADNRVDPGTERYDCWRRA
jgi:hypothetical protein